MNEQRFFEDQWRAGHYARHRKTGRIYFIEDTHEYGISLQQCLGGVGGVGHGPSMHRSWDDLQRLYEAVDAPEA